MSTRQEHLRLAEVSLLGSMLLGEAREWYPRASAIVEAADFSDERDRLIWRTIGALVASDQPVDVLTLTDALRERGHHQRVGRGQECIEYLAYLVTAVPSAENCLAYARIVRREALRRRLELLGRKTAADAGRGTDPDELAQSIHAELQALGRLDDEAEEQRTWAAALRRFDPRKGEEFFSLGVPRLDALLGGGVRRGQLVIIGGSPGVGKSSLTIQMILGIAKAGHRAGLISAEMSLDDVLLVAVAQESRTDTVALRRGGLSGDALQLVTDALERIASLPLTAREAVAMTPDALLAEADRFIRTENLQALGVDFIQLFAGGQDIRQQVSTIARGLKRLAERHQIVVFGLSQLSRRMRGYEHSRPRLTDLKESGGLEESADVVLLLWRPEDPDEHGNCALHVIAAKNRGGPVGYVSGQWIGRYQSWEQVAWGAERAAVGDGRREDARGRSTARLADRTDAPQAGRRDADLQRIP